MEIEFLKPFIGQNVELLVGGVWIEGHFAPIVKGVITLNPIGDAAHFYGLCSLKAEAVQAVRLVKSQVTAPPPPTPEQPGQVRSSLDQVTPGMRFARK